jgi:uncharacterized membrane protein
MIRYSDEVCSVSACSATVLALSDHGHVLASACRSHTHVAVAALDASPDAWLMPVVPPARVAA